MGDDLRRVVAKEGKLSLRRGGGSPNHVLRYARLRDFETELQQFAMDTWSAPQRMVDADPSDQRAQFRIDWRPTICRSGVPTPVTTKTSTVPPDHSIGRDHNQGVFPRRPEAPERNPEQLIQGCQSGAPVCPLEHGQLLTKREIFD